MRCGAKTRHGGPCQQWAVRGRPRCRMHGGKSLIGPSAGGFRHGRYSKCVPVRLAAHYRDAATDPELLSLRHDLALTDARIIDLLKRVDTGEAGATWRDAQAAMARVRLAQEKGDIEGMQAALAHVEQVITRGSGDYAAWEEISGLIEQRRRLADSEHRRLTTAHEMLSAESAMSLLAQVVDTLQRHIPDKSVLGAIAADLQRLGHRDPSMASRN